LAKRHVFFYEVRPTRVRKDAAWRLDRGALFDAIEALSEADRVREIKSDSGDSYEFVQVLTKGDYPTLVFARCREDGLPLLAQATTLEPFELEADRNLAELTHVTFFNHHVLGAEYNHYGPSASGLASYLAEKTPDLLPENGRIRISSLVDGELLTQFHASQAIKAIELRVAPQLLDAVNATKLMSDNREALKQIGAGYGATNMGLFWRNNKGLERAQAIGLIDWAVEHAHDLLTAAFATVKSTDGTTEKLNLLKNKVGAERDMELISATARSIAHESATAAIVGAYGALTERIKNAAFIDTEDLE
jgi:hypothetical protein